MNQINIDITRATQVSAPDALHSAAIKVSGRDVDVHYGTKQALFKVSVDIPANAVTAFIEIGRAHV